MLHGTTAAECEDEAAREDVYTVGIGVRCTSKHSGAVEKVEVYIICWKEALDRTSGDELMGTTFSGTRSTHMRQDLAIIISSLYTLSRYYQRLLKDRSLVASDTMQSLIKHNHFSLTAFSFETFQ